MKEYYYGCCDCSTKKALELVGPLNIIISYASPWRVPPKNRAKLFIDSGAYAFLSNKTYTGTIKQYLEFVKEIKADYFASRDYPCAPSILKAHKATVRDHQLKTLNSQEEISELINKEYPELKEKFIGVLQGKTVEDYLWMLKEMKRRKLLTPRIAIGGINRKSQNITSRKIINEVRSALSKNYELHAFGVKFSLLQYKDCWEAIDSADSSAFSFNLKFNLDNPKLPVLVDRLNSWKKKLSYFQQIHNQQTLLF